MSNRRNRVLLIALAVAAGLAVVSLVSQRQPRVPQAYDTTVTNPTATSVVETRPELLELKEMALGCRSAVEDLRALMVMPSGELTSSQNDELTALLRRLDGECTESMATGWREKELERWLGNS